MVHSSLALLAAATSRKVLPRLQKAPIVLTDAAVDRVEELLSLRHKVSCLGGAVPAKCCCCADSGLTCMCLL